MRYTVQGNNRDPYAGVPEPQWTEQGSDKIPGPHLSLQWMALCVALLMGLGALGFVLYQWVFR